MSREMRDPAPKPFSNGLYQWHYDKANLEHGAYALSGPDGKKIGVILPADRSRPIEAGKANAWLQVRAFGSEEWQTVGRFPLHTAITHGSAHADRYEAVKAEHTLQKPVSRDEQAHAAFLSRLPQSIKGQVNDHRRQRALKRERMLEQMDRNFAADVKKAKQAILDARSQIETKWLSKLLSAVSTKKLDAAARNEVLSTNLTRMSKHDRDTRQSEAEILQCYEMSLQSKRLPISLERSEALEQRRHDGRGGGRSR